MKIYTHDYTLPSQVASQLYFAQQQLRQDNIQTALAAIDCAREILDSYLAQDNMVEDEDVDGWVKLSDIVVGEGDDCKLILVTKDGRSIDI